MPQCNYCLLCYHYRCSQCYGCFYGYRYGEQCAYGYPHFSSHHLYRQHYYSYCRRWWNLCLVAGRTNFCFYFGFSYGYF